MKAFVIGGSGFIGSHIVDKLLQENNEVVVIDNLMSGQEAWIKDKCTFYQMDILDDQIEMLFANEKPDYVFHMAAQISVAKSMALPVEDANLNIIGTIKILQHAVKYQVKRFIFSSSVAVYGMPDAIPITEKSDLGPLSCYGLSKLASENYIKLFCDNDGMDYSIFRFANVFGPRQNSQGEAGVISIFTDHLRRNQAIKIFGDGMQTRDFIYVEDVAQACVNAVKSEGSHILNLGTNMAISINQLVHILSEITDTAVEVEYEPARLGDIKHCRVSNEKAKEVLNWLPQTRLERGLFQTFLHQFEQTEEKVL